MKKVDYYLRLPYRIEIVRLTEDEGGGCIAFLPELARKSFRAYGDTADEALENLELVKRHTFSKYIAKGIPIAEPVVDVEREFSGRFVVRMPKDLHRSLADLAQANSSSLNQYITYLLTRRSVLATVESELVGLKGAMWQMKSNFETMKRVRANDEYLGRYSRAS